MRKQVIVGLWLVTGFLAKAQKDDIEYYTDANTVNSRFNVALILNPNYTDRRLINDEVPIGGAFDLPDDNAQGTFQLNYNLDVFFELGESFDIGVGFGRAAGSYSVDNVVYRSATDTILVNESVDVSMFTIPIKVNFNTSISDVFDLEVVPTVQLNFIDKYDLRFDPQDGSPSISQDLESDTEALTYSVGISLGGTYYFADQWGIIFRGSLLYMINPLIERTNFPRETLFSYGVHTGIKYAF